MSGAAKSDTCCSNCILRNHADCVVSSLDSSRCYECVRLNKSYCDVQGLTPEQLDRVSSHYFRLEEELEEAKDVLAEAAAKVARLWKQKKVWYERIKRAVAQGITDLEELDRVEREEAEAACQAATAHLAEGSSGVDPASLEPADLGAWVMDPELAQSLGFNRVFP